MRIALERRPSLARTMQCLTALTLCLSWTLLAGCQTTSTASSSPESEIRTITSGLMIDPDDAIAVGLVPAWASNLAMDSPQKMSTATLVDDLLFITEGPSPLLTVMSLRTGEVVWRRALGKGIAPLSRPLRRNDRVGLFVDGIKIVILDTDTGEVVSRQRMDEVAGSSPDIGGDRVVYGSLGGRVIAHDLSLGFPPWKYDLVSSIKAKPVVEGNTLFAADDSGTYVMLALNNGDVLWRGRAFGAISASPVIAKVGVLMPSEDGTLYVLDETTGQDLWLYRTTTPLTEPAMQIGPNVYLPVPGRALVAFEANRGEELWQASGDIHPIREQDGKLLAYTTESLLLMDPDTGRIIEEVPMRPVKDVIATPNGGLLLVSEQGRVLLANPAK